MKTLTKLSLILAALALNACAHATTEMDRELALKLVDKAGRIEIVQTMNGNMMSQPLIGSAQNAVQHNPNPYLAQTCRSQPMYDLNGNFTRTDVQCQ